MKKIEIIHDELVFESLQAMAEEGVIDGYTTLDVLQGQGPLKGSYRQDYIRGRQYYTFAVVEDSETEPFLKGLKKRLHNTEIALIVSDVQTPNFKDF